MAPPPARLRDAAPDGLAAVDPGVDVMGRGPRLASAQGRRAQRGGESRFRPTELRYYTDLSTAAGAVATKTGARTSGDDDDERLLQLDSAEREVSGCAGAALVPGGGLLRASWPLADATFPEQDVYLVCITADDGDVETPVVRDQAKAGSEITIQANVKSACFFVPDGIEVPLGRDLVLVCGKHVPDVSEQLDERDPLVAKWAEDADCQLLGPRHSRRSRESDLGTPRPHPCDPSVPGRLSHWIGNRVGSQSPR